ncbi:ABC transporter substrate-binding protein [Thalassobaculum salexigens]|uniref:ABC transporter substrate-binding protein n=1 Tax=Thalassobaculum salexigens TaxID=455360 RepID=UPI00042065CA|nr:ABC transporter substrate-binding protein [Thalassobaculum salexigens]
MKRLALALALLLAPALLLAHVLPAAAQNEPPLLAEKVATGALPETAGRLPFDPLVVDLKNQDRELGDYGGTLNMVMAGAKDVRQMVVYGYARLVGYDPATMELRPDLAKEVIVEDNRSFTFVLREGHRWSDGTPFTTEDFRYFWEDVANNPEISPTGPPIELMVDGEPPTVEILSPTRVRYSWSQPNPDFLPQLAGARPLYLYRPSHHLKMYHDHYAEHGPLKAKVEEAQARNWAALHNREDNPYKFDNPDLPTLQPWVARTSPPANRYVFERNPYYHKIDAEGRQLPYIDTVVFQIASPGLIPAKTGAGESDLQARYLNFEDYTFLRQGAERGTYETYLWKSAKGSHLALFPNLNIEDPLWREVMRDARFRRALSLAVNRHELNEVIYFGLALEGNNTVLPSSRLYEPEYRRKWAEFDLKRANALLDEMGLTERDDRGVRLLPDGRPMEIIVETAGESTEETDLLELIHDTWLAAGIKLYTRPSERTVFRNRIFAGQTMMAISFGIENGIPSAESSPSEFAPTAQTQYMWPRWGQYYQTKGKAGTAPDIPEAVELMELYDTWRRSSTTEARRAVWHEMLEIWSDQVFSIGLIAGVLQPVVVSLKLHNVPVQAIYNWDPGAHFGMHRPDTFFFGAERPRTPDRVLTAAARSRQ